MVRWLAACAAWRRSAVEELVERLGQFALGVELSVLVGVDAHDLVEHLVELGSAARIGDI